MSSTSATITVPNTTETETPDDAYTVATKVMDRVITRLTAFYDERNEILNDRDLVLVNDTIDTARFLKILFGENRTILDQPEVTKHLEIIYGYAMNRWTGVATDIAIVDVIKVYNEQRGLVSTFYEKRRGWSFFSK